MELSGISSQSLSRVNVTSAVPPQEAAHKGAAHIARATLRPALSLPTTADGATCDLDEPYLDYIEASWPGRGSKDEYLHFVADVVGHFTTLTRQQMERPPGSVQQYIDGLIAEPSHYYFPDTLPGSSARETSVRETVLLVLGTWLLLQAYFIPMRRNQRCIVSAFCLANKEPYSEDKALAGSLVNLVAGSGLLPNAYEVTGSGGQSLESSTPDNDSLATPFQLHSSAGLLESVSIDPRRVNAARLAALGQVEVIWTANISRHLLLSRQGERPCLELFALPCALQGGGDNMLVKMGILPLELVDEIEASYATLFHPVQASRVHRTLAMILGLRYWCWCLDCASYRLRRRVLAPLRASNYRRSLARPYTVYPFNLDARLEMLVQRDASQWQWDHTEFRQLWPRILALDAHLEQTKPWSFWVIFRDRRDTVQYWTFL